MNISQQYFLVVANELNLTRAAKKLYVSQQALSQHIKNLEAQYRVKLFYRKPVLALTPAGEQLYATLCRIQLMEKNLETQLCELDENEQQVLTLGIHAARFYVMAPPVCTQIAARAPNMHLNVVTGHTVRFEHLTLDGEMDLFLGVNPSGRASLRTIPVMREDLHFVITDALLRKHYKGGEGEPLRQYGQVPLHFCMQFPCIYPYGSASTTGQKLLDCLRENKLSGKTYLTSEGDVMTNFRLMQKGLAGIFLSSFFIKTLLPAPSESSIWVFSIAELQDINRMHLCFRDDVYIPRGQRLVTDILVEYFASLDQDPGTDRAETHA